MSHAVIAPAFWQKFALIHRHADSFTLHFKAWAIDEVMEEYLDRQAGLHPKLKPLTDAEIESLPDAFWDKVWNRKKKHRRRREAALNRFPYETSKQTTDMPQPRTSAIHDARHAPDDEIDRQVLVKKIRARVDDREWYLMFQLAEGRSYADLAKEQRQAVGTIKSVVFRCRARLRGG